MPQAEMAVLVKNDSAFLKELQEGNYFIQGSGQWPEWQRTFHFGLACIGEVLRKRPALIICMHMHFSPLAMFMHKLFGTRYIVMAYGIEVWHNQSQTRKKAMQRANLILAISNYTRDYLIEHLGIAKDKIHLLAPTYSPDVFSISRRSERLEQKYNLTPGMHVIFTVCRLAEVERYKGYDQIIRALPKILKVLPDTRYVLGGKGPDLHRVQSLIEELQLEDAVTLAGFIPDEELAEHYNLCDVFAMPSKAEGFGIVYLEALSCGKPVLAGNRDGSRDAVADGELGVLIDPDNVDEIADNLIQILQGTHPHPLIYQPEELRKRVIEKFGFESFQKKVHEYLAPFLNE